MSGHLERAHPMTGLRPLTVANARVTRRPIAPGRDRIPLEWLQAAARLPGRSLHVALALWLAARQASTRRIPLGNVTVASMGLDRNAKYRGLVCLERAGLVTVERNLGRSPIVTLLMPEPNR